MSAHIVELWEMVGDRGTVYTPACLNCGWIGGDAAARPEAEAEAAMHERGERQPWQFDPGSAEPWRPGTVPATRTDRRV